MALDRDLNVNVTAATDKFERGMRQATVESRKLGRELKRQERQAEAFRQGTGRAMAGVGVGILAGAGLAVKAAVEWESAWAGVTKTVDGNAAQMAQLEGQLRSMARELPSTHQEIAAVAEAAGQLGIKRESITSFTRTMIALGETTDLTAEQAATAIAQISNVMGTSQGDVDRFGSALVALGNNGASTESQILEMAQRIAGAGKQIGLSETDVLAFSSALSSVGIEAEAGGSAISTAMVKIATAVNQGGEELDAFAKVAGMSADDFKVKFETDAAGAIDAFVQGLGRIQQSGGDTFTTLSDLGLGQIRVRDSMLRLSGAGDLLTESLATGNAEWENNSALLEEAAKRYETTESKMQVARNNINDLGITIGETLLPVIGEFASTVRGLTLVFEDLPAPVKTAVTVFGSLLGAVSLLGGAALLAGPKIAKLRTAAETMATSASRMNRGLGTVGTFLTGPWGAAIGAATIAVGLFAAEKAEAAVEVDAFRQAIEADNGALGEHSRLKALEMLQQRGMTDALKAAKIPLTEAVDALVAQDDSLARLIARMRDYEHQARGIEDPVTSVEQSFRQLGETFGFNETGVYDNERALHELAESLTEAKKKAAEQKEVFGDELPGAMGQAEGAAEDLTGTQQNLADKFDLTRSEAEDASGAIEEYLDLLKRATDPVFALVDALDGVTTAQRDYNKAVKKYGDDSPQAEKAALSLAKAVANAEAAAINGDLSYEDFRDTLKRWVKQGVVTAEQAKTIEGRVKDAREEAEDYAGDYTATLNAKTKQARDAITELRDHWNKRLQEIKDEKINIGAVMVRPPELRYPNMGRATGGILPGPPSDKDNMLLWAASGEYVVNARSTGKYRDLLEAINADLLPGYAKGGRVGGITATATETGMDEAIQAIRANLYTAAQALTLGPLAGAGGGSGVQRWAPTTLQALAVMGQPAYLLQTVLRRMNQESGGNPSIVNRWDSNWARGTPSVGLMQVIGPTYRAYRHPRFDVGPYLYGTSVNPMANLLASMRYALGRYGSLPSAYNRPGGYDLGGVALGKGWLAKNTVKPERVLSPQQTIAFERLVKVLDTHRFTAPAPSMTSGSSARSGDRITNYNNTVSVTAAPTIPTEQQVATQLDRIATLHGL